MPEPLLRIDADTAALVRAVDQFGKAAERYILAASQESGRSIQGEARRRLRSQQTPESTGHTASQIVVRDDKAKAGVLVFVDLPPDIPQNLDMWLHFGTRRGQPERPYLLPAAQLEEGPHMRRIIAALNRAAMESGLGE